jgi:hypothetical protein
MGLAAAAAITATAAIGGAAISGKASKKAAAVQERASDKATVSARETLDKQIALQEPFRQGGLTAQNELMQYLGIGGDKNAPGYGSLGKSFDELYGGDKFQQDPSYQFRVDEGVKALDRSAAARGMLQSGATLKGITRFGQREGSQEYQNAFNRYQVERSAKLNPLQSLMGSGQSATNVMTGSTGQFGQNEQANIYNAGQARASGYIGQANALTNALGQIAGYASAAPMNKAIMGYYNRNAPGGTGTGPGGTFEPGGGFGSSTPYRLPGLPRG